MTQSTLTRRRVLASTAAGVAAGLARPALAQAKSVKFTLPWLAEGSSVFLVAGSG